MNDTINPIPTEQPAGSTLPRAYRGYYFFTLIASLIGAFLQMVLLLSEYDIAIGMYRSGSTVATLFTIFVLLVTGAILTMPFVCKRTKETEVMTLPEADTPVLFASTLSGFILVAVLILQICLGMPTFTGPKVISDYFWLAVMILLTPTAIFFFLPALPIKHSPRVETALAFFPVLWCAAYLMNVYFNNATALKSPVRILTELAMIGSMLFFLMELRVRVGKPNSAFLLTFINISIFFSTICAIPLISVAFINQWELTTDILYSAVQLCFLTYFVARANTLIRNR